VLYLAEVQKKSGVFGGGKADLKLLACQRADSWSAVPNQEIVAAEEANSLNPGALVLVDLTANKQVQRLRQDTPGELLKILQSFSRQIDKYKKNSEEIEQWKESLIFQSEELQRREEEIQSSSLTSFLRLSGFRKTGQRNAKKWILCERSPPNSKKNWQRKRQKLDAWLAAS
jgi:hypothetical protein